MQTLKMYPEISAEIKEFLFLEFCNGMISPPLLHKFRWDKGFQQFVMQQYEKKVNAKKGLQNCKMPHPCQIEEDANEALASSR